MPGPLGKLTAVLGVDASQWSSGIQGAQKDLAGFGLNTKGAFTALGAAATAGFGLMTKGALDAEGAQGRFMAATGASREEAKKFVTDMDGLAGTAGAVGLSFDEISEAGIAVSQQFGVTGQDAQDLTGNILDFAKITGQDAAQAAGDLEDMLSAMGLEADDAVGVMDQLVASSQKYGTDAGPAAVGALNDMAPALTAMGMGLDDGIELLNAFEVAGGDAGSAAKGLRTAVKQLKPGEDIDDLIVQIAGIEDPLLKSQKASELFGKQMGPQLAALIKPGMTSLDDFGVSAEEATGSVKQGVEDMLTTSDKIRGFFDKIGAGAREMGQQFGPAIGALGTLGSAFGTIASTLNLDKFAGTIKDKLSGAFKSAFSTAKEVIGSALSDAWSGAKDFAKDAISSAATFAKDAYSKALDVAQAVKFKLQDAWTAAKSVVGDAVSAAASFAKSAYQKALEIGEAVAGALSTAWEAAKNVARSAISAAASAAGTIYQAALRVGGAVADALGSAWDAAKSLGKRAIEAAGAAAGAVYAAALRAGSAVADALGTAWDFAKSGLKAVVERAAAAAVVIYAGAMAIGSHITDALSTGWDFAKGATKAAVMNAGEVVGGVFADAVGDSAGEAIATGAAGTIGGNLSADAIKKSASKAGSGIGKTLGTATAAAAGTAIAAEAGPAIAGGLGAAETGAAAAGAAGLGTSLGLFALLAFAATSPLWIKALGEKLTGTDQEGIVRAMGVQVAAKFFEGANSDLAAYSGEFAAHVTQSVSDALEARPLIDKLLGFGVQEAMVAGVKSAETWWNGFKYGIDHPADDARESGVAENLGRQFANDQALKNAGITASQTVGDGFSSSAEWNHSAYLASLTLSGAFPVAPGWIEAGENAADKTGNAFANAPSWDHYAFLAGLTVASAFPVAPGWIEAAENAREKVTDEFVAGNDWTSAGNTAGQKTSAALASGILDNRSGPKDAWQQYVNDMKNMLDPMTEIAWLNARLTGKKLAEGLNSTDPLRRAAAQRMYDTLKGRLDDLGALGYDTGQDGGQGVATGLNSKRQQVTTAADGIKTRVESKLDSIDTQVGPIHVQGPAMSAVAGIANGVNAQLGRIKTNYIIRINATGNVGGGVGGRRALGGPVRSNTMYEVTEGGIPEMLRMGGKSFLLMGTVGGYVERINKAMSGFSAAPTTPVATRGGGGGVHINISINGNQYGGRAGLRDLAREIENAVRQGTRGAGWQVGR